MIMTGGGTDKMHCSADITNSNLTNATRAGRINFTDFAGSKLDNLNIKNTYNEETRSNHDRGYMLRLFVNE